MTTETIPESLPECLAVLGIPLSVIDSYESALALIRQRIIDRRQTFTKLRQSLGFNSLDQVTQNVVEYSDLRFVKPVSVV